MDINSLSNNPEVQKLLPKVYDDLLSEPFKKVSTALSDTLEFVFFFSKFTKFGSKVIDIVLDVNLRKLQKKLEPIPDNLLTKIPTEIAVPILQKLSYTASEDIVNLFVNLLATASNSDTASQAHPAFIQMIERLSVDEARIISWLHVHDYILYADVRYTKITNGKKAFFSNEQLTDLSEVELTWPNLIPVYLNNLVSMGVLTDKKPRKKVLDYDAYASIRALHTTEVKSNEINYEQDAAPNSVEWVYSFYEVSQFGSMFIRACLNEDGRWHYNHMETED